MTAEDLDAAERRPLGMDPERGIPVDLRDDGILLAINAAVFHPRGHALAYSPTTGGFVLLGDGTELIQFGDTPDTDRAYTAFRDCLERARLANRPQDRPGPAIADRPAEGYVG